ncbi:hypothetical protein [Microbacterium testaceum]|uniref:hypothetical protein n=1 Tax=Microbacterium testaceum TaxID=2033 RepID=UPI0025B1A882|nr:hypothetical protein [Microbacterium testaceum]WJS91327.1 hypothetical protein NYQ11_01885 [Microbacterium testaceum]
MASPRPTSRVLSRGDTAGFVLFLIGGVAIAVAAVVQAIADIARVLPNRDITLLAPFAATDAQAPLGPGGSAVTVQLDSASVTVASLQPASLAALVISHAVFAAAMVTVVTLLLVLCFGILRGRIFSRAHTALVTAAGLVAIAGMYFVPFFHNMAVNGALALVSEGTYDRAVVGTVDVFAIFAVAFVVALAGTVFAVGDRLQRDTEGLV